MEKVTVFVSSYADAGGTQKMDNVSTVYDILGRLGLDSTKCIVTVAGVETNILDQQLKDNVMVIISQGSTKSGK